MVTRMRRYAARTLPPDLPDQPKPGDEDVISEIVDHILAGSTREEVRQAFAGTVVYVSSRPRLSESQKAAIAAELQRDSIAVVAARWKITPRHCRRLKNLSKPRSGGM
jgi:predicted nucleic acid-binding protein